MQQYQADELKNMHRFMAYLKAHCRAGADYQSLTQQSMQGFAIHHLPNGGFTHKQLMQTAQHAVGDVTSESLNQALLAMENRQVLRGQKTQR